MEIIQSILTQNPCYTAGKKISVKGLMLHSVGCPQPSAEVFVKKLNSPAAKVCVHGFIDGKSGKTYQTLPWNAKAWHCGGNGNSTHIGIEMCEPACIKYTGGAGFTCSDRAAAMEVVKCTYDAAVELFAYLCKEHQLNPLADGVIISHKEGHDRGLASGHGDPDHLWKGLQAEYSMDTFRQAVAAAMGNTSTPQNVLLVTAPQTTPAKEQSTGNIQAGDVVALVPGATYYTGKTMPDWVLSDKWIVKSVSGDRAVIDKNVSGSRAICSPVNIAYLTVAGSTPVSQPAPVPTANPTPKPVAPATPSGQMSISDRGVEMIAKYEGCRLEAYKCPAGVWTIGYGHTAGVQPGNTLPSKEAAKALLKEDLKKYGASVNNCVAKGLIAFPLTQNQFDALTSFCYNCGAGNLKKLVSGRDAATIADKLLQYNKGGGKVLAGLTKRRTEERELFLS